MVGESKMFSTVVGWVFLVSIDLQVFNQIIVLLFFFSKATNVILYVFQAGLLVYVGTQGPYQSSNATALLFDSTTSPGSLDDSNKALILTSILVAVLENSALVREYSFFFFFFKKKFSRVLVFLFLEFG